MYSRGGCRKPINRVGYLKPILLMKKMLIAALLFGGLLFTSCTKDDGKDFNGLHVVEKSGDDLNLSFDLSGELPVLLNYGEPYEVQTIDCQDDFNQGAGQYIVTRPDGKRYIGLWQDKPFDSCVGHCFTGKNPKGLTRYYQTFPLPSGIDCDDI